jgi:hypothetical protein
MMQTQYEMFLEGANNTRTFLLAARRKKKSVASKYEISRLRFDDAKNSASVSSDRDADGTPSRRLNGIIGTVK